MQEAMQIRLEELKAELQKGEAELQRVEAHRAYLQETLLRIGGAVQALEELLSQEGGGQSEEATAAQDGTVAGQQGSATAVRKEKVSDKSGV